MAELVAVTRRVDGDIDLVAAAGGHGHLFVRDGAGLAARGEALRVPVSQASEALGAIKADDEVGRSGCGAVAFGALPFDPRIEGTVVVPEQVVGRDADGSWVTTIGARGAGRPEVPAGEAVLADPSGFEVRPSRPPAEWCDAVAAATARIRAGELDKVVLAREVVVTADGPISVPGLLGRLRANYPGCFLYAVDGLIGASPELLVGRQDDVVTAQPMAGTTARRGDPDIDAAAAAALFGSATYRHEHQVTIDMVHDTLLRFSSYIDYEPEPSVVALANVQHLATQVEGRLSHPPASVLELVQALHPTPAVCGRPRDAALALIAELEGFDRGRYGGAVGWVDAAGNGTWAVAIRCALVKGSTARVYAGNGIVGDSDPATELAETRAKFQALLTALVRP